MAGAPVTVTFADCIAVIVLRSRVVVDCAWHCTGSVPLLGLALGVAVGDALAQGDADGDGVGPPGAAIAPSKLAQPRPSVNATSPVSTSAPDSCGSASLTAWPLMLLTLKPRQEKSDSHGVSAAVLSSFGRLGSL